MKVFVVCKYADEKSDDGEFDIEILKVFSSEDSAVKFADSICGEEGTGNDMPSDYGFFYPTHMRVLDRIMLKHAHIRINIMRSELFD